MLVEKLRRPNVLILRDPLCDCGKKACRPGSCHSLPTRPCFSKKEVGGWLGKAPFEEKARLLSQFLAHIGHQRPRELSFNCSPPNRLLLLQPLSLHRCFSRAMVGSFQRTAIRRLETIQMTSNGGDIRQITVHAEDGLFHSH